MMGKSQSVVQIVVLVGQLACQLAADEGVCPNFPYATTIRHTAAGTALPTLRWTPYLHNLHDCPDSVDAAAEIQA